MLLNVIETVAEYGLVPLGARYRPPGGNGCPGGSVTGPEVPAPAVENRVLLPPAHDCMTTDPDGMIDPVIPNVTSAGASVEMSVRLA